MTVAFHFNTRKDRTYSDATICQGLITACVGRLSIDAGWKAWRLRCGNGQNRASTYSMEPSHYSALAARVVDRAVKCSMYVCYGTPNTKIFKTHKFYSRSKIYIQHLQNVFTFFFKHIQDIYLLFKIFKYIQELRSWI